MKSMETTPRKTKLYNQLVKDYAPKKAEMQICRYIEKLEQRIVILEEAATKKLNPKKTDTPKPNED